MPTDHAKGTLDPVAPIVHRFEEAWLHEVPELEAFLPSGQGLTERRELLLELVLSDLYFRWSTFHEPGGQLPSDPRLEDYASCFSELTDMSWPIDAVIEEYRIRRLFSDFDAAEYQQRFPDLEDLESELQRQDVERCEASVYVNGKEVLSTPFRSRLELGRQRRGDPDPVCVVATSKGQRLLIAAAEDRTISRSQLKLTRIFHHRIKLRNSSVKTPCRLRGRDSMLPPGGEVEVTLPQTIEFQKLAVCLSLRRR